MTENTLWIEQHMQRLHQPDGKCFYCEQPADRLEIGPVVVKVSDKPDGTHRESCEYDFCSWECLGHWAAMQAGFEPRVYPSDPRRRAPRTELTTNERRSHPCAAGTAARS